MPSDVAVLGLGNMGAVLAGSLLDAGHDVTVWNRTPGKAEPLAARGARVASSAAEAVADAPLTVVCVARYENVYEALGETGPDALEGRTLANLTWGLPRDAGRLSEWVADRGGTYLDGGIPVTPSWIGRDDAELVWSGPTPVWERHAATLRAFGAASVHVGEDAGAANVVALAIPGAFYNLAYLAFFESAAYAASHGVPPAALRSLVRLALRLSEEVIDTGIDAIERGDYADDDATLWVTYDALVLVRDAFVAQGQRASMVSGLVDTLARGVEAGHADDGCAALFRLLRDGG